MKHRIFNRSKQISFAALFVFVFVAAVTGAAAQIGNLPIKSLSYKIDGKTDYVNVMGDEMPPMPQFSAASKKTGYVRGCVKNSLGEPVAGAKLGLKSARIYDGYLAAAAETDQTGCYEIKIPTGGARFDYAGYTMKYSRGQAALGLHPADGGLSESYPAATGAIENFVMLPYGIANRADAENSPRYRSNYYGGTFLIRYFIGGFDRMLKPGEEIFIALKPVSILSDKSPFARAFVIRKTVEDSSLGEFYICNVPVGRYEIFVTDASGKSLKMRQKAPTDSVFGIQPTETTGSAQLIFNPLSADAKTAVASRGNWTDLEIIVERP
jgi:hypothetical protein